MSLLDDPRLDLLLASLHVRSNNQTPDTEAFYGGRIERPTNAEIRAFRRDKLVALDPDKARFCYQLCRASDARHVVEIGTSYGVSTLYLAAAVRDNLRARGGRGIVVGTEYEPLKAEAARQHFVEAGLSHFIDLREGDFRETLKQLDGPVDFLLVDIWVAMARSALELVAPRLRLGAVVVCDNTERHRSDYANYFAFLADPANGFKTMTLPFDGGLELSVRVPVNHT